LTFRRVDTLVEMSPMKETTKTGGVPDLAATLLAAGTASLVWFAGLALLFAAAASLLAFGGIAWLSRLASGRARGFIARADSAA
jgi:hypothetical protein